MSLALISPFTLLSLPAAAYCLTILSSLVLMFALWSLLRYASEYFQLSFIWKAVLVCLCAAAPLTSFALGVGNVSVMASALSIIAFTRKHNQSLWIGSAALAVALVLKPHLAIWFVVGMILLPQKESRAIARRSSVVAALFTLVVASALIWTGSLGLQMRGFLTTLHSEMAVGGSMSVLSREVLPSAAQITSLQSVVAFWTRNTAAIFAMTTLSLFVFVYLLTLESFRADTEQMACVATGAWSTFGMLATYHRAHDALALLILAPYMLHCIRRGQINFKVAVTLASFFSILICPEITTFLTHIDNSMLSLLGTFLIERQAGLGSLCLLTSLILILRKEQTVTSHSLAPQPASLRYSLVNLQPAVKSARRNYAALSLDTANMPPQRPKAGAL